MCVSLRVRAHLDNVALPLFFILFHLGGQQGRFVSLHVGVLEVVCKYLILFSFACRSWKRRQPCVVWRPTRLSCTTARWSAGALCDQLFLSLTCRLSKRQQPCVVWKQTRWCTTAHWSPESTQHILDLASISACRSLKRRQPCVVWKQTRLWCTTAHWSPESTEHILDHASISACRSLKRRQPCVAWRPTRLWCTTARSSAGRSLRWSSSAGGQSWVLCRAWLRSVPLQSGACRPR